MAEKIEQDKTFLSLKWKVFVYLVLVLLATHFIYGFYSYRQLLQELESEQWASIKRDQSTLKGLIGTSYNRLLEVGQIIPMIASGKSRLPTSTDYIAAIRQYVPELLFSGVLDAVYLYNQQGKLLERQGDYDPLPHAVIDTVLANESPLRHFHCAASCLRSVAMPVLLNGEQTGVLVVSRDMRDIVLDFKAQYGRDIGLAVKAKTTGERDHWQYSLQYLTQRENNLVLLGQLLRENAVPAGGGTFELENTGRFYQIVLQPVIEDNSQAFWVMVHDRTDIRAKAGSELRRHVTIAGLGLLLAGMVQILVLRRPMRLVAQIAELLPLLARSSYSEVRQRLAKMHRAREYRDELDILQDSTGDLAIQLEHMEETLLQRARNLQQRSEQLKSERDFVNSLLDTAETVILTMNSSGEIVTLNRFGEQLFGRNPAQGEQVQFLQLSHQSGCREKHEKSLAQVLTGGREKVQLESAMISAAGGLIHLSWLHTRLHLTGSDAVVLSIGMDITERTQAEQRLSWLANHDSLTKLPNQLMFNSSLEQILRLREEEGSDRERVAILFCDFDGFKDVNDSLGHPVGDELLQLASRRISNVVGGKGVLARQGGDEFTVILSGQSSFDSVAHVAQQILEAFRHPFSIAGYEIFTSISIGISVYPDHGRDRITLVKNADMAMFDAKERGKNQYCFYEDEKGSHRYERFSLINDLRKALERNEFRVVYQPQIDARNGQVMGMEALLRWHHSSEGVIPPDKFIPLAEETGLIIDIGRWVLNEACRNAKYWNDNGMHFQVGVNLAGQQILHASLLDTIRHALDDSGLEPELLDLEVTENFLLRQPEVTLPKLQQIREMGVCLSMDDFGTGYSSLSYLKNLPLNTLKIDKSFINDIGDRGDGEILVKAIIAMAQSLGLECIAEGVETPRQLTYLLNHGCHQIQGYYFSKPLPEDEVPNFVRQQMRKSMHLKK